MSRPVVQAHIESPIRTGETLELVFYALACDGVDVLGQERNQFLFRYNDRLNVSTRRRRKSQRVRTVSRPSILSTTSVSAGLRPATDDPVDVPRLEDDARAPGGWGKPAGTTLEGPR